MVNWSSDYLIIVFSRGARDDDVEKYFCAPAFVYCFPFLEWVLSKRVWGADMYETVAAQALQIIGEHMAMRGADGDDLFHPRFLPRKRLLSLVISVISKFSRGTFSHCSRLALTRSGDRSCIGVE